MRPILALNPNAGRPLIEFHGAALRNTSPLPARDKELLAAYVSALNACQLLLRRALGDCEGVRRRRRSAGRARGGLGDGAVDEKLKPMLAFARKLTLTPARMTQTDTDAVIAAGWDEAALDAILTVCLFNFMNRLVEGHGIKGRPDLFLTRGRALHDDGYAPMLKMLDEIAARTRLPNPSENGRTRVGSAASKADRGE